MPSYTPLKELPHAEKMRALRDPELCGKFLAEKDPTRAGISVLYRQASTWQRTFPMGTSLNYFPDPQNSIVEIAARRGCTPLEAVYDLLLEDNGHAFLMYAVAGYADGNREPTRMKAHLAVVS
jgi:N-acyl-D-aspartate/D-glutamate deacylase